MSKEKRRVPKLRFPGFTEDWEQCKLSDILVERNEQQVETNEYPLMSFVQGYGVIPKGERYDRSFLVLDQSKKYKRTELGDFIYSSNNLETGSIGINKTGKAVISPVYSIFYGVSIGDSQFIGIMSLLPRFISKMIRFRQGVVYGQWRIHEKDFLDISILIPSVDERTKITKLILSLEELITLHQRKLEHLKLKKKALLQKLFPKNGERYPELRFPGFTDAWEQRKLSDISTKVTTKNVDVHYTETLTNSAEQGIISQVDFFDKEISNKDNINGYYIVDNNDFIYNPRISTLAPVGPINRNKLNRTGIMSPLYTVFRASNVDLGFLEWYFQSNHWHRYMKLNGDSGARADRIAIKDSTFFEMPIKTPVNIKEQVLIGETLEKFNQYITLHQRKLGHLQLQKKALLQQMFV